MIFRNVDGVIVASLKNDVLSKKVNSKVHRLRTFNGYAFDRDIIEAADLEGCQTIRIIETDTGVQLEASMRQMLEKGVEINYGHGEQLALPGSYWRQVSQGQNKLL